MYDYNNGRFLSVDPFIQNPTSTQSMNPYTYIFNNPLSGIDPTGYLTVFDRKKDCADVSESACNKMLSKLLGPLKAKKNGKKGSGSINSIVVSDISEIDVDEDCKSVNCDFLRRAKKIGGRLTLVIDQQGNVNFIDFNRKESLINGVVLPVAENILTPGVIDCTNRECSGFEKTLAGFEAAAPVVGKLFVKVGGIVVALGKYGDDAIESIAKLKKLNACCFVAGTQVLTKDGYKNIEDVKLGELVWAKDVETGQSDWKPVSKIYVEHDRGIYHIRLRKSDGNIINIEATDDHPFYVVDYGWKTTVELQIGDNIETKEVGSVVVVSVEDEQREDTTYNFEIADFHTYYVTEFGVLVHNCSKYFNQQKEAIDKVLNNLDYVNRGNVNLTIAGGTEGAIKYTRTTKKLVGGSDHFQKGTDALGKLKKIKKRLKNSSSLSNEERATLLNTIDNRIEGLVDALYK